MASSKKLIIVGDSAFAEIAFEYFDADSEYLPVAFAVESEYLKRDELNGRPIVSFERLSELYPPEDHSVFVAVAYAQMNRLRCKLAAAAKEKGYQLASYVSSRAFVWRNVEFGEHCFVFEDNTIQPFVRIGSNVILWSGNHIGHHSVVRDNCFISSHVVISGFCDIGENTFIGVNATLANNLVIGADNWIGPNTAIMRSTDPNSFFKTRHPAPEAVSAKQFFNLAD